MMNTEELHHRDTYTAEVWRWELSLRDILTIFVLSAATGACVMGLIYSILSASSASSAVKSSHPIAAGVANNAIANFGLVPLNQEWLFVTDRNGQPFTAPPTPDQAMLTTYNEPEVHRPPYIGGAWTITFK
jgi:hypothetical protein